MFGYATRLRSITQGRATYTMQFAAYEPVPQQIYEELMARSGDGGKRGREDKRPPARGLRIDQRPTADEGEEAGEDQPKASIGGFGDLVAWQFGFQHGGHDLSCFEWT